MDKEGNHKKNQDVFFLFQFFYEWYKKIPYSLSIRLYLDQLINLNSIRKADKSRLSCAILIKIYREEIIYNESKENSVSYANNGRAYLRV